MCFTLLSFNIQIKGRLDMKNDLDPDILPNIQLDSINETARQAGTTGPHSFGDPLISRDISRIPRTKH